MTRRARTHAAVAILGSALVAATPAGATPTRGDDADDAGPAPHGPMLYGMWLVDQLELAAGDGADAWRWDADAWLGGETQRIVLESEGERRATGAAEGEVEVLLLYDRAVSPFWNVQLGLRQDILFGDGPDAERTFAVLGLEGVAPLWIELEPRLFVSDDGDTSLRLEATHELSITQRLVAQSRVELDAALGNARRFGVRSGLSGLELGLRIRYELRRELAPYLGVIWHRTLGHTRSLAREQDDPVDDVSVLVGVRFWY